MSFVAATVNIPDTIKPVLSKFAKKFLEVACRNPAQLGYEALH